MCRNIKPLFNFEPPVTEAEVRDAALQFVRKVSGYHHPARANEAAFNTAVDEITDATHRLMHALVTEAPSKSREIEAAKARERAQKRFGVA
jgi:hypothetical protein